MLTKAQEIDILLRTITELGPDSYLASWLNSVVDEVRNDLRNDIFPTSSPRETRQRCDGLLSNCRTDCANQLAAAKKDADRIREQATRTSLEIRAYAARLLQECASRLA